MPNISIIKICQQASGEEVTLWWPVAFQSKDKLDFLCNSCSDVDFE
jgi:hypothetical protein